MPNVVIAEQKGEALHDKIVSVFGLAFECVMKVCKSYGEVNHWVTRIKGVSAKEVIYDAFVSNSSGQARPTMHKIGL